MSVNGLAPEARSRVEVFSWEIGRSVCGSITIIRKPSRPPQSPTIRPCESNAMVAHSRRPYDENFTCGSIPSGPLNS
jgi:hypothetical protein